MILITTPDTLTHGPIAIHPDGTPDLASYSTSVNTQTALAAAYAAGNWQPYTPPAPVELPPEPNPTAFRAALASAPSWLAWAETVSPAVLYTNLATAAALGNWSEADAIYTFITASTPPAPSSIAEWQALADSNGIPINF